MSAWGCLLVNLGTPRSPAVDDVGVYLKEFLLDPEVIDIPWWQRQVLVRGVIVPFRKKNSARLYRGIWTQQGSPLLVNTRDLRDALQTRLPGVPVQFGFRYGEPSLKTALEALHAQGARNLFVIALYPQYSTSATRSVETELTRLRADERFDQVIRVMEFHDDDFYIASQARLIGPRLGPDSHLLFSFHGIPVRQITKNHRGCDACFARGSCDESGESRCYRRQCQRTAEKIAARLELPRERWSIGYQSRLGRNEWVRPSTEEHLQELLARGVRDLVVATPGFTADCLETIEELGEQLHANFMRGGGQAWSRVDCLNADPFWADQLSAFIQTKITETAHGKTPS